MRPPPIGEQGGAADELYAAFPQLPPEVIEEVLTSVGWDATMAAECLISMTAPEDEVASASASGRGNSQRQDREERNEIIERDEQIERDELLARQMQEEFALEDRRMLSQEFEEQQYRREEDVDIYRPSTEGDVGSSAIIDGVVDAVSTGTSAIASGVEAISSSVGWGLAALSDTFQSTWSSLVGDDEDIPDTRRDGPELTDNTTNSINITRGNLNRRHNRLREDKKER